VPLAFASAPLLRALATDGSTRLYFESGEDTPDEKFSAPLLEHELGAGVIGQLVHAPSQQAWDAAVEELRLAAPLAPCVTVHWDVMRVHEQDLARRVHPCLVRLQPQTPAELIAAIREGIRHFTALGVSESSLQVTSVMADWS